MLTFLQKMRPTPQLQVRKGLDHLLHNLGGWSQKHRSISTWTPHVVRGCVLLPPPWLPILSFLSLFGDPLLFLPDEEEGNLISVVPTCIVKWRPSISINICPEREKRGGRSIRGNEGRRRRRARHARGVCCIHGAFCRKPRKLVTDIFWIKIRNQRSHDKHLKRRHGIDSIFCTLQCLQSIPYILLCHIRFMVWTF